MAKTIVTPGKKITKSVGAGLAPAQNQTIYSDKPIEATEQSLVINQLQVRQVIRTSLDIQDWRSALRQAEARYTPQRSRLYYIYEDTLLDGHLSGIISKRLKAVLNKPLYFKDINGEEIPAFNPLIRNWEFKKAMGYILETIFWGITGIEFIPGETIQARLIPRRHIKTKTQKIAFEQYDQDNGIDYTTLSNVLICGEPEDLGLLNALTPYVIYKRNMYADWAQFIEIFGQPVRIAKYDVFDDTTKLALEDTLQRAGSSLALLIPKTAEFEMLDGKTSNANGDLQYKFKEACNQEMSIIVLGNTETTTSHPGTGGTGAKAKTHQDQQQEIAKYDIAFLESQLNNPHFLNILASYGYNIPEGAYFEFSRDIDIDILTAQKDIYIELKASGLPISDDTFYEKFDIPKPAATDTISLPAQPDPKPDQVNNPINPKPAAKDLADEISDIQTQLKDLKDFFVQAS